MRCRCGLEMTRLAREWRCAKGHTKPRFIEPNTSSAMSFLVSPKNEKTKKWLEELAHENDKVGQPKWHWYQKEDGTIVEKLGDKVIDVLTVPAFCTKLAKQIEERKNGVRSDELHQ